MREVIFYSSLRFFDVYLSERITKCLMCKELVQDVQNCGILMPSGEILEEILQESKEDEWSCHKEKLLFFEGDNIN